MPHNFNVRAFLMMLPHIYLSVCRSHIQALIELAANKYKNIQDNCFSVWRPLGNFVKIKTPEFKAEFSSFVKTYIIICYLKITPPFENNGFTCSCLGLSMVRKLQNILPVPRVIKAIVYPCFTVLNNKLITLFSFAACAYE